ncbi:YjdF family protein [Clostridium sp. MSJ-11]|uniref:YjdF family protein n=1 Tax=Clostridium mobile TaxID=2841512 RepID=A0ABS6EDT1_9CLOT|nr:YjdF family protein [Clostridium mobile]MBU5483362.1 YjdF family protein [Clostridium mobile]
MYASVKLTVFFEEPFWVGVLEKCDYDSICVCRVVFGEEPKDYEIYEFLLKEYRNLKFSSPISTDKIEKDKINPKRLQRKIKREIKNTGVGTKAQLAMKQQYEVNKTEKRKISREEKEQEKERQYALRQHKKKEKHRGH